MAEGRPYGISLHQPELVLCQLLQEAYHRWLRPMEVCEILQNYKKFNLAIDPPQKPQSGSLFLFDRKALRYFRNDGHNWRKKKDGKTVREAHERLKAGSVNVLHCYYAHGEDNENFQRRSYWMLEGVYEHIVLVHYREVKEGKRCENPQPRAFDVENKHENGQLLGVDDFYSRQPYLPASGFDLLQWKNYLSDGKALDSISFYGGLEKQDVGIPTWTHVLEQLSALEQKSLLEAVVVSSMASSYHTENIDAGSGLPSPTICYTQEPYGTPSDNGIRNDTSHATKASEEESADLMGTTLVKTKVSCHEQKVPHILHGKAMHEQLGGRGKDENGSFGFFVTGKAVMIEGEEAESHHDNSQTQEADKRYGHPFSFNVLGTHDGSNALGTHVLPEFEAESLPQHEEGIVLEKLDSFGRWMSREIGGGENLILPISSDSAAAYWQEGTLDCQNMVEEVSVRSMQLDVGLCLSLSQEQCFSIIDFSPDQASFMGGTKVLVSGTFLEALKDPSDCQWGCMFGEVEVPAELLCGGVLRCKVPPHHAPGRVPFYITRCDRVACSEVREFILFGDSSIPEAMQEEALLRVRFARMLACTPGGAWVRQKLELEGNKDIVPKLSSFILNDASESNDQLHEDYVTRLSDVFCKDMLMQKILKVKLHDWLVYRVIQEDGKGGSVLNEHGLGVIHMGAALGYDWVISPLLAAGVSIDFRDARGWSALHWAAYHGREKMVVALLAAGAAPGAKADPTHAYPGGQTPADLASLRKHKGIAGYLAELSLTTHLSLLKINGGEKEEVILNERSATCTDENPYSRSEDHISLKEPLAAVRNSIQAAARIHAVFRAHSFRRKHENHRDVENEYGISNEEVEAIVFAQRGHKSICNNHLDETTRHYAAIRIQQRFRGWKGRRDFLLFQQRVVKIQAHVRGHQVRKHLKKLVWSISIVEKVILRWRRKRKGLRGFGAESNLIKEENGSETDNTDGGVDFLKLGRKQNEQDLEKALARVQSMVKSREARDQYRRILDGYRKAKENSTAYVSSSNKESSNGEDMMMSA